MAIRAGNRSYEGPSSLPNVIPVFPLAGAILLPDGQLPLNIFEPRYLAMVESALKGDRIIGMVQPCFDDSDEGDPALCEVGCAGRITQFSETGDGRVLVTLGGICRFRILEEVGDGAPYRECRVSARGFERDFQPGCGQEEVDREALLATFRDYLDANNLEADWESVDRASNAGLVNALSMMSPCAPPEKQALLEAPDLKTRAETLVAITEIALAREGKDTSRTVN